MLFQLIDIVQRNRLKALGDGMKALLIGFFTCRYGRHCSSVKGICHGNDFSSIAFTMRVFPCKLDRSFDGFRAGIREKDAVKSAAFDQFLREPHLRFADVKVRDVDEFFCLFLQCFHHGRMAMAEVIDGYSGQYIEILIALDVPDFAALPFFQGDGISFVGRDIVFLILACVIFICLEFHKLSLFRSVRLLRAERFVLVLFH